MMCEFCKTRKATFLVGISIKNGLTLKDTDHKELCHYCIDDVRFANTKPVVYDAKSHTRPE